MLESTQNTACTPYQQWLPEWLDHLPQVSAPTKIPPEATCIESSLIKVAWYHHLRSYLYQGLVQFFLQSLSTGFRIGFSGSKLQSTKKNLQSTVAQPKVVEDYIHHELALRRMSGSYPSSRCRDVHINRFGVIPKNHQPDKWRLITDLSYPPGGSVNDGISPALCSLSYVTIDHAILSILQSGRGIILAKIDIKSAFQLLPVHPADRHLLGMN